MCAIDGHATTITPEYCAQRRSAKCVMQTRAVSHRCHDATRTIPANKNVDAFHRAKPTKQVLLQQQRNEKLKPVPGIRSKSTKSFGGYIDIGRALFLAGVS